MEARRPPRFRTCVSGNAAVEFALILPIFLALLLGVIEYGRAMFIQNTLQYGLEEATRYAVVRSSITSTEMVTYAKSRMTAVNTDAVTFTATTSASEVSLDASYEFNFLVPDILPFGPITLTASSRFPRS